MTGSKGAVEPSFEDLGHRTCPNCMEQWSPGHHCKHHVYAVRAWRPLHEDEEDSDDISRRLDHVGAAARAYLEERFNEDPHVGENDVHVRGTDGRIYVVEVTIRAEPVFEDRVRRRSKEVAHG